MFAWVSWSSNLGVRAVFNGSHNFILLQPAFPPITAWEMDGIRVAFEFSKPPGQPAVTDITATYTTASTAASDFTLQVRVECNVLLCPAGGQAPKGSSAIAFSTSVSAKLAVVVDST